MVVLFFISLSLFSLLTVLYSLYSLSRKSLSSCYYESLEKLFIWKGDNFPSLSSTLNFFSLCLSYLLFTFPSFTLTLFLLLRTWTFEIMIIFLSFHQLFSFLFLTVYYLVFHFPSLLLLRTFWINCSSERMVLFLPLFLFINSSNLFSLLFITPFFASPLSLSPSLSLFSLLPTVW